MLSGVNVNFDLSNPFVVIGLLVGGMLPYLFGSMGMQAVGRAGGAVVIEVRRQFKKNSGIMKGKRKPDYGKLVDLLTKAAIKEMIIPSMLPVLSPIILYLIILPIGGIERLYLRLVQCYWGNSNGIICCNIYDSWWRRMG